MERLIELAIALLKLLGMVAGGFFLIFSIAFLAILLWGEIKGVFRQ
jgi:hypothetical protein